MTDDLIIITDLKMITYVILYANFQKSAQLYRFLYRFFCLPIKFRLAWLKNTNTLIEIPDLLSRGGQDRTENSYLYHTYFSDRYNKLPDDQINQSIKFPRHWSETDYTITMQEYYSFVQGLLDDDAQLAREKRMCVDGRNENNFAKGRDKDLVDPELTTENMDMAMKPVQQVAVENICVGVNMVLNSTSNDFVIEALSVATNKQDINKFRSQDTSGKFIHYSIEQIREEQLKEFGDME
jgi:hypothetical protein